MTNLPRSVRNHNPGNIRVGTQWRGMMPPAVMTLAQKAEHDFVVFAEPRWGFRALAILLRNYQTMHGLTSIGAIISRFAPQNENNTQVYAAIVAKMDGVEPHQSVDLAHDRDMMFRTCKAIGTHETGYWPEGWDEELNAGLTYMGMSA